MNDTTPPNLLNDDGTASMATMFMSSHHGMRRDLALFARALRAGATRGAALDAEWQKFRATLHAHHEAEDHGMFPNLRAAQPSLAPLFDRLQADHRLIDPILERGDRAFADLPASAAAAAAVVDELAALLATHLALEETQVVPCLRAAKAFPPPATDAESEMFAHGFAWSLHGLAPDVAARVLELLPESVTSRLPEARAAYAARCERAWGTAATGASRTSVPDWLGAAAR